MTLIQCPRCLRIVTVSPHSGDYQHICNSGNEAVDNEDIVLTGGFVDYAGSEGQGTKKVNLQGVANEFQGTKAWIVNKEKQVETTARGNRKSTHRSRQHIESIDEEYIKQTGV